MTKSVLIKHIIISTVLTLTAIALVIGFCTAMFQKYSPPTPQNTVWVHGTVTDVYHGVPSGDVAIVISNGDTFYLAHPWGTRNLYATIGYDVGELADLLEGKEIECLQPKQLPWAIEIRMGNLVIDNHKLTSKQIIGTRVSIIVIGLLMLALIIVGDTLYLKRNYNIYKKAEKKRIRKAKQKLKKLKNN